MFTRIWPDQARLSARNHIGILARLYGPPTVIPVPTACCAERILFSASFEPYYSSDVHLFLTRRSEENSITMHSAALCLGQALVYRYCPMMTGFDRVSVEYSEAVIFTTRLKRQEMLICFRWPFDVKLHAHLRPCVVQMHNQDDVHAN